MPARGRTQGQRYIAGYEATQAFNKLISEVGVLAAQRPQWLKNAARDRAAGNPWVPDIDWETMIMPEVPAATEPEPSWGPDTYLEE
jgi:hypothetical protein